MWPWQVEKVFGYGLPHALSMVQWYVANFPVHALASVVGVVVALCLAALVAALVARWFAELTKDDPLRRIFMTERTARKKGYVRD